MKKLITSITASAFILLISFQNCQKPPYPDEINGLNVNAVPSLGKIDLSKEEIISINFVIQDTQAVTKAGNTYQINYNKILEIDLKTGIIRESSDLDSTSSTFCLSESLKNELVSILKSSQVCRKQPTLPSGTVCTQVMKMPYAQLMTLGAQFDLGSATDGCGSNSLDLCDDQPDILKGYIEAIKKQYLQLACSF